MAVENRAAARPVDQVVRFTDQVNGVRAIGRRPDRRHGMFAVHGINHGRNQLRRFMPARIADKQSARTVEAGSVSGITANTELAQAIACRLSIA
jgi:hypothetical protein